MLISFLSLIFLSIVNLTLSWVSVPIKDFCFSVPFIFIWFSKFIEIFLNLFLNIFFLYTFFVEIFISLSEGVLFFSSIFISLSLSIEKIFSVFDSLLSFSISCILLADSSFSLYSFCFIVLVTVNLLLFCSSGFKLSNLFKIFLFLKIFSLGSSFFFISFSISLLSSFCSFCSFSSDCFSSFLFSCFLSILNWIQFSIFWITSFSTIFFSLILFLFKSPSFSLICSSFFCKLSFWTIIFSSLPLFLICSSFWTILLLSFILSNLFFCPIIPSIVNLLLSWESFSKIGFTFIFSIAEIYNWGRDTIELCLNLLCIIFFLNTFFVDIFISLSGFDSLSSRFTSIFSLTKEISSFGFLLIFISSFLIISNNLFLFRAVGIFSFISFGLTELITENLLLFCSSGCNKSLNFSLEFNSLLLLRSFSWSFVSKVFSLISFDLSKILSSRIKWFLLSYILSILNWIQLSILFIFVISFSFKGFL